jgi:glycosyltransferase involved in cell wall biosynthesis
MQRVISDCAAATLNQRTILFVSHDAVRAGASLMLLVFLRWLKNNGNIPFQILICGGGELEAEFEKLGRVWYLDNRTGRKARLRAALRKFGIGPRRSRVVGFSDAAERISSGATIGLIFSNTVVNGRILNALSALRCPILTYVHELEFSIRNFAGRDFDYVKEHTEHFVAVSEAARENLISRHAVSPEKIERIRGFLPATRKPGRDVISLKRALAAEIGCSENARIVGGCGAITWHKGCDLFLQLALAMRAFAPPFPVHLVWVGSPHLDNPYYRRQEHDLAQAGLTSSVHFVGAKSNALDYIAAFDVHALPSREESLSLVMLEAATLEIPTVCFAGHGSQEFVEYDAGMIVPYLDIQVMAQRVLQLLLNEDLRQALGQRAKAKAHERHDVEVAAPLLLTTMERMLG